MLRFNKYLNKTRVFIEKRNLWFLILGLFCFGIVVLLLPKVFYLGVKVVDSFKEKSLANQQFNKLIQQKEDLTKVSEKLETDFGLEMEIREKFPVVKEGEEMIVFVNPNNNQSESDINHNFSFWQKLKNLFR